MTFLLYLCTLYFMHILYIFPTNVHRVQQHSFSIKEWKKKLFYLSIILITTLSTAEMQQRCSFRPRHCMQVIGHLLSILFNFKFQ